MGKISIGADIGGSHITTMAADIDSGTMFRETYARCDVNKNGSPEEILEAWKTALHKTMEKSTQHHLSGIGFAMPGPFDYPNGIALFQGVMKFDALYGWNIRQAIQSVVGLPDDLPVRFLNDATCFAIGEAWLGEASAFDRVLALTLGTGFGSAFLKKGVPVSTGCDVPLNGWVYHLPFGGSIADDHFSTRWFTRRYAEETGGTITGTLELASKTGKEPAALQIFHEFGRNLGEFLAPLIVRFGAQCLVAGGNISQGYDLFRKPFLSALEKSGVGNVHVCVSQMGEDATIAGSARLSDNDFYNRIICSQE